MKDCKKMADLSKYLEQREKLKSHMENESNRDVLCWYEENAQLYEQSFHSFGFEYHKTVMSAVLKHVKDKNSRILDCGAGSGVIGEMLVENGYHNMDALDGSKSMLDIAKGKNIYEKLVCATIGTKPIEAIETNAYDLIVSAGLFAHGAVYFESIPVLMEHLKQGGYFIFDIADYPGEKINRLLSIQRFKGLAVEWEKKGFCRLISEERGFHSHQAHPNSIMTLHKI
ncbi:uncharacterized protein [Apostichopus japonicus]|uniref:uncharacterized protein isoform X2 n=1 Tax=Stichopus japonicus TaxID=307972 RepID=UPI003AB6639C